MPRLCPKWQDRGGPLDAAGIKNKFPVLKIILPVSSPKIPCCDLQGISSKVVELSAGSSGDPCCNGRILVKFPVFFPVSTFAQDYVVGLGGLEPPTKRLLAPG
jgi:hypothetical protein